MNLSFFEKKRLEKINNYLLIFQLAFHFIIIIWFLQFQTANYSTIESFYSLLIISFLGILTLFFLGKIKVNLTRLERLIEFGVLVLYLVIVFILVYMTQSFVTRTLFFIPLILIVIKYGKKSGLIITFFTLLIYFLIDLILNYQNLEEFLIFSIICYLIIWLISNLLATEKEIRDNLIELVNRDECIFENNDNGIIYIDKNNIVKILNNKAEKLLNLNKDDYLGKKNMFENDDINSNDFLRNIFSADGRNCCDGDKSIFFFNNRDLFLNSSKITDVQGNYLGKIVIIKDLTQGNLLHAVQQNVQFISNSINMPIISIDMNGYITFFNDEAVQLFEKKDNLLNCDFKKVISDEKLLIFINEELKNPKHVSNKELSIKISGVLREVLISIGIIKDPQDDVQALTFLINDVTEIREKERFMAQADKLSTVGQLAAGVAHEIRNPLTAIKGMAQMLKRNTEVSKSSLDLIVEEANRANSIIKDFLAFAKPAPPEYIKSDFNKMINDFCHLMESHCLLNDVKFKVIFPNEKESMFIYWDEKKIKQVFLNLCLNALDAMKECTTKTLEIEIEYRNDKIIIFFKDTGVGMEEEVVNNIWEPFFTTKNEGTGLGLSICNKIIEEHGGSMDLTSELNKGSSFKIVLPVNPQNS